VPGPLCLEDSEASRVRVRGRAWACAREGAAALLGACIPSPALTAGVQESRRRKSGGAACTPRRSSLCRCGGPSVSTRLLLRLVDSCLCELEQTCNFDPELVPWPLLITIYLAASRTHYVTVLTLPSGFVQ
jgi:hypothetical protein